MMIADEINEAGSSPAVMKESEVKVFALSYIWRSIPTATWRT